MRRLLFVTACILVPGASAGADDATDLRDRALAAHAKDPADLKKFRVHTLKAQGVSKVSGEPKPTTWEVAAVWPGDMRLTWEFGTGAKKTTFTVGCSGDRGWRSGTGMPAEDLPIAVLNDVRADAYAIWVATLMTLKDDDTRLAVAPGVKVEGNPTVGLKVSRRPWPDIALYFDEKTNLLRKMAYKSREAGVFLDKEFLFDGYKDAGGMKLPTKQTTVVDGRVVAEWTEIEYAFPEKIDPKMFTKP